MRWSVKLSRQVTNFLKKHKDKKFVEKIIDAFEKLKKNPYPPHLKLNIKKMIGSENDYRLRIGKYRFIYTIIEDKVLIYIYKASSRGDVYKG